MFDRNLVLSILQQIDEALEKIKNRSEQINSADDFTDSSSGMEKLDSICMLFIAIGEALKNIDKVGYALDGTYPKRLCFRVRPSRTPFIRSA